MPDGIWVLISVVFFILGLALGTNAGERAIKRRIVYHIFSYRDKTIKEMLDDILGLTDEYWEKIENDKG